jgi:hypothetical protein
VKVGNTRHSVDSAVNVAKAARAPSALNSTTCVRTVATNKDTPMTPEQVMITAENTVSRAKADAFSPPETIKVTIRATSMTVTATARTSEPNGSPTRWATISA